MGKLTTIKTAGLSREEWLEQRTMLALISAALVLLLTLIRVVTPRRIRLASRTNLADAWISRLTLGRKT